MNPTAIRPSSAVKGYAEPCNSPKCRMARLYMETNLAALGDCGRSANKDWMTNQLHIRCNECQHWLAGPLARTSGPSGDIEFDAMIVGFDEYLLTGDIQFSTNHLYDFSPDSEHDLLVHPQWYRGWRRDWPDPTGCSSRRRKYAIPNNVWGCCGVNGQLACECGNSIGRVSADCIGTHWMVLHDSQIQRSDNVDGIWTIHDDAENETEWIECHGMIANNFRTGEWESWLVAPRTIRVQKRDKDRNRQVVDEEALDRRLVKTSQWDMGTLLATVDE